MLRAKVFILTEHHFTMPSALDPLKPFKSWLTPAQISTHKTRRGTELLSAGLFIMWRRRTRRRNAHVTRRSLLIFVSVLPEFRPAAHLKPQNRKAIINRPSKMEIKRLRVRNLRVHLN